MPPVSHWPLREHTNDEGESDDEVMLHVVHDENKMLRRLVIGFGMVTVTVILMVLSAPQQTDAMSPVVLSPSSSKKGTPPKEKKNVLRFSADATSMSQIDIDQELRHSDNQRFPHGKGKRRRDDRCPEEEPIRKLNTRLVELEQLRERTTCPQLPTNRRDGSPTPSQPLHTKAQRTTIPVCNFAQEDSLFPPDHSVFSGEGYDLARFLYDEMFLEHGWVAIPTAGTALGALRHRGMLPDDDDMDFMVYPPLPKKNSPPSRKRTADDDGSSTALRNHTSWLWAYDEFDKHVESWRVKQHGKKSAASKQHTEGGDRHGFAWHRHSFYRGERGEALERRDATPPPSVGTMTQCHFDHYDECVNMTTRECGADYVVNRGDKPMSEGGTELRRMFFVGRPCMTNHFFLCFQPSTFMFPEGPTTTQINEPERYMFTSGKKTPLGPLCRVPFGPTFVVVPERLQEFVEAWYGDKWCVPTGAVRGPKTANFKSWSD